MLLDDLGSQGLSGLVVLKSFQALRTPGLREVLGLGFGVLGLLGMLGVLGL